MGYLQRNEGKEQESRRTPQDFIGKKVIMLLIEENQNL